MVYQYRCKCLGHITEHSFPIAKNPEQVECTAEMEDEELGTITCRCPAERYIGDMAPVQFNGTGWAGTAIPRTSGLEGHNS